MHTTHDISYLQVVFCKPVILVFHKSGLSLWHHLAPFSDYLLCSVHLFLVSFLCGVCQSSDGMAVVFIGWVEAIIVEFPPLFRALTGPLVLLISFFLGVVLKFTPLGLVILSFALISCQPLSLLRIELILGLDSPPAPSFEKVEGVRLRHEDSFHCTLTVSCL